MTCPLLCESYVLLPLLLAAALIFGCDRADTDHGTRWVVVVVLEMKSLSVLGTHLSFESLRGNFGCVQGHALKKRTTLVTF